MADPNFKKISDMAALTTAAADDIIPIVDVSEAADANKNKKITTANLRKNITNAELAGSITAAKIAGISSDPNADRIVFWDDGAGSLAYLTPGSGLQISDTTLNAAAITGTEIADGSIDSNHIAAGAIDLAHMSANSVDSNQYVDGSIDRVHLSADIIDSTKLADNSVNSEHYVDGSIDTAHIGNAQVTNAKLGSDVGVWQSWTPTVTYDGGTTNPTSHLFSWSQYARIGNVVFYYFLLNITRGSGYRTIVYISTPTKARNHTVPVSAEITEALVGGGNTYPVRSFVMNNSDRIGITLPSAMTGNGIIYGSGFYEYSGDL